MLKCFLLRYIFAPHLKNLKNPHSRTGKSTGLFFEISVKFLLCRLFYVDQYFCMFLKSHYILFVQIKLTIWDYISYRKII